MRNIPYHFKYYPGVLFFFSPSSNDFLQISAPANTDFYLLAYAGNNPRLSRKGILVRQLEEQQRCYKGIHLGQKLSAFIYIYITYIFTYGEWIGKKNGSVRRFDIPKEMWDKPCWAHIVVCRDSRSAVTFSVSAGSARLLPWWHLPEGRARQPEISKMSWRWPKARDPCLWM